MTHLYEIQEQTNVIYADSQIGKWVLTEEGHQRSF